MSKADMAKMEKAISGARSFKRSKLLMVKGDFIHMHVTDERFKAIARDNKEDHPALYDLLLSPTGNYIKLSDGSLLITIQ